MIMIVFLLLSLSLHKLFLSLLHLYHNWILLLLLLWSLLSWSIHINTFFPLGCSLWDLIIIVIIIKVSCVFLSVKAENCCCLFFCTCFADSVLVHWFLVLNFTIFIIWSFVVLCLIWNRSKSNHVTHIRERDKG